MSRWIEVDIENNIKKETIASRKECKKLVNEICTEGRCDQCCDYPHPEEYCKLRCPYFEKEDGIIEH